MQLHSSVIGAEDPRVLILAGGEGRRLRSLTTLPNGTCVPKQFCSLTGHRTLIEDAIARADGIAHRGQIYSIVDVRHRAFWDSLLKSLRRSNIIVHPFSRGTGIGILHSLLAMDAEAEHASAPVVILPSDHYVREEQILRKAIRASLREVSEGDAEPILLGFRPDREDPELGYIVPHDRGTVGCKAVDRFVEKPAPTLVRQVMAAGGLWNSFIVVASVQQLLSMFSVRYAEMVLEMQAVLSHATMHEHREAGWVAITDLYSRLPSLDFSRDIVEDQPQRWRVMEVPECGWSDLGTPARVAETVRRMASSQSVRSSTSWLPNLGSTVSL